MSKKTLWPVLLPMSVVFVPFAFGQTAPASPVLKAVTLRQAAELALAKAPELAVSRASAEEAAAAAELARDAFHPEAFVTTTPGYATGLPVAVAGRVPAIAGIEIHQTLYNPARRAEALQAGAQAAGLAGALENSRREALRSVVSAYARYWADEGLLDCARRRLTAQESLLRRVTALEREGRQTVLEVERAALKVARAKQKLLNSESDRDLDQLELRRWIGWSASQPVLLAEDPLSVVPEPAASDTFAAARAADPGLHALSLQRNAAERAARLQARAFAPVLEAEAQYSRLTRANRFDEFYAKFKADDFSVGVSVAVPLWTGNRRLAGASRARAHLAQVEGERQLRESNLETLARQAESELSLAGAERSLALRSQSVAQEALRQARLRAQEGRGEADDIEQSEMALADADEEVTKSALELVRARARLLTLRGELSAILAPAETSRAAALSGE